jgi:small conductance mechanosensitive channel
MEKLRSAILLATGLMLATLAVAQQEADAPAAAQPLTEELRTELDGMLQDIERDRADAARTNARIPSAEEPILSILNMRLAEDRIELLSNGVALAERVVDLRDEGYIVDDFIGPAVAVLQSHPPIFQAATTQAENTVVVPTIDMGAAEQAAAEERFFSIIDNLDRSIALMVDTFELLDTLGSPAPEAEAAFENYLVERAASASIYLQMARTEANAVRAGLRALPNDAELTGKLTAVEARIRRSANVLQRVINTLEPRGIDVTEYRQQLVLVTGEITPDVFRINVITGILRNWGEAFLEVVAAEGPNFALRVFLLAAILYVFWKLARITRRVIAHGLSRSSAQLSQLLQDMILATAGNLILFLGALIALSQIGISLGPVLAGLGIAGFVIGFALQDSLSNFASGLLILFTRPYDVGDVVEVGSVMGKVHKMSIVNTTINTFDNQRIILPNSMIWQGVIKNVTSQTIRRVDMVFGVSYADDIEKTEKIIAEVLGSHELILDDPEPIIKVHELGESSVNFVVRPWVRTDDYWTVYWDITRAIKIRFDAEGISIPFPQRDVHLFASGAARQEIETAPEHNEPKEAT